jgi:diaminopimelate epimerase
MGESIEFEKLSGSGNDFICIDNRDGRFDALVGSAERIGHFARTVLRRRLGVGADGLLFAETCPPGTEADLCVRFFEPDGTEAELCGNGTACFAGWAMANGWVEGDLIAIDTPSGVVWGKRLEGGYVRACIPLPRDMQTDVTFELDGRAWWGDFAVTGVPHLVVYVDDVETVDMAHLGPAIRRHERFGPRGVNVNFTQVVGEGRLAVRTFEFGVEDETLACGTGSSTAAAMAALRFGWPEAYLTDDKPVRVRVRSGDELRIWLGREPDGRFSQVCLETVVRFMFRGTLHPSLAAQALGEVPAEEAPEPVAPVPCPKADAASRPKATA